MGEAEEASFKTFNSLCESAREAGIRLSFILNGNARTSINEEDRKELWRKFEFDCDLRLPSGSKQKPESVEHYANKIASLSMNLVLALLPVEEATDSIPGFESGLPEGAKIRVEVNKYERNPVNRAACISHYGAICQTCDFDFGKVYGELGREYIEVHHLIPVSQMGGEYKIDPVKDLIPLCSNCHAMIHRKNPPLTPDELKEILKVNNGS